MAEIRCGNCGASHGTVAEVRRCHAEGAPPSAGGVGDARPGPVGSRPGRPGPMGSRPGPPGDEPVIDGPPAQQWPGPDGLGRSLVVRPGAPAALPWSTAPRARLELGPPSADQAAQLHAWWTSRTRFVVEVAADDDERVAALRSGAETDDRAPWEVGPGFAFLGEAVVALAFANAIDARRPDVGRWALLDRAVRAGARPLPGEGTGGDVALPDGRSAWLDGGPLQPHGPALAPDRELVVTVAGDHRLTMLADVAPAAALADDQLAAVAHRGGGARIIAPAGSGKTRVLTERARHLLADWGVPASNVCLVAFNVRAAEELRSRTADLPDLHIRTLNSLGLAIVNGAGPFRGRPDGRRFDTIDEREVRRLLERMVRFPRRAGTDPVAPWLEALSAVRLGLRAPEEVEASFGGDVDGFADILPRYREELSRRGVLDYDEQICSALERLLRDPAARRTAQQACRLLLVDEFQDLAPAHLLLVRLLSAPGYDCFGVGDDDQTIYGYVGASPDWLVRFPHWFPGSTSHALEVNYRCAPGVVEAAGNVLTRNARRVPKTIRARPGRAPGADDLVVEQVDEPVATTVARVSELVAAGVAPAEIAVLVRVNVTLLGVQLLLAERDIPTTAPVTDQLLGRSGVRSALAWLGLATSAGRLSAELVADAARRPPRGLSPRLVGWMAEQSSLEGLERLAGRLSSPRDADKVVAFVAELAALAEIAAHATTAEVLLAVRDRVGLGTAMETLDRSRRDVDRSAHGDDLAALIAVARLQPDPSRFPDWLRGQLQRPTSSPDGVHLSTVHRVKGREWPYVVVHDASAGLMPHRLAGDVEEERRIFHVALTRSSRSTFVVADRHVPSPFLAEMAMPGAPTVRAEPPGPARGSPERRPAGRGAADAPTPSDAPPQLVAALKAWRLERARRDGVPPYVVLHDKNLLIVAARRPTNLAELARCPGIGPAKLERYGDEILGVIASD